MVAREVHFLYDWCNIKEGVWPGQFQIFFSVIYNVVKFVKRDGLINSLPQRSASLSCEIVNILDRLLYSCMLSYLAFE